MENPKLSGGIEFRESACFVFFPPIKSGHFCHCFIECRCLLCWERSRGGGGSCTGSLREHLHTPSGSLFVDSTAPVSHCFVVTERKQEQAEALEAHELWEGAGSTRALGRLRALGCGSCDQTLWFLCTLRASAKPDEVALFCKWGNVRLKRITWNNHHQCLPTASLLWNRLT